MLPFFAKNCEELWGFCSAIMPRNFSVKNINATDFMSIVKLNGSLMMTVKITCF